MKNWFYIAAALISTFPALCLRFVGIHPDPQIEALIFGLAIAGGAFLLSWGCEVAQLEVSQALALAGVALVAVLPEYAVDMYFAWMAAEQPEYASYAAANMTGANRLLIGIGWPMVAIIFWLKEKGKSVELDRTQSTELSFLLIATIYSFIIPLKGNLSLVDTVILVGLFGAYIWASFRVGVERPQLVGPSAILAALPGKTRRVVTISLFLFPAVVILASAKPFAEGLIQTGKIWGIDEFILVQWLAPLASEAPELLIAAIFTLSGNAAAGIGILVSSKVNQWTLLVGSLPLVYCLSLGEIGALPLDARQAEEILLTSAQSIFAIALLSRLRFSLKGACVLLLLFVTQLVFINPLVRYSYSGVYLLVTLFIFIRDGENVKSLARMVRDTIKGR
jgi:cation:H+ antiporter